MYKNSIGLFILLLPLYVTGQEVDPTKPFGMIASSFSNATSSKKEDVWILQSIIQSNNTQKAVIDGQLLNIGDTYKGFKLAKVSSKGVVLHSSQGEMELSLFSSVIVKSK